MSGDFFLCLIYLVKNPSPFTEYLRIILNVPIKRGYLSIENVFKVTDTLWAVGEG